LNSVRERALRQNKVRLHKAEPDTDLPRNSMQKIRTLKSLANEAEREMEDVPAVDFNVLSRAWDWFQRSIGNR
jgi:hypothetical protein